MNTPNPSMIVFCGLMGTGKTTLAIALNRKLGNYARLNTDDVRRLLGKTTFDTKDTPEVNSHIYFTMRLLADQGKGIISDSANKTKIVRERLYAIAREFGIPILVIECIAKDETSLKRISSRPQREGVHKPTNNVEDYHHYLKLWETTESDVNDPAHKDISFIKADSDTNEIKIVQEGENYDKVKEIIEIVGNILKDIK